MRTTLRLFLLMTTGMMAALSSVSSWAAPAKPQAARSAFVHPDTVADLDWRGAIVGVENPAQPNQWIVARRTFDLPKGPGQAVARIAVDSKYWLWINGTLVCREGGLKRGPTPTDTYFDEVEVGRWLRPGANTVAVLVWHFGKEGFSHKNSGTAGLLMEIRDGEGRPLLETDHNWKARLHPAFGNTGEPHPNYRLPESNIRYDAQHELSGWEQPGYDDQQWPSAVVLGLPGGSPWNRLVRRPIPLWAESDIGSYTGVKSTDAKQVELPSRSSGAVLVAELPYNAQVTPYFEIEAPAGLTVAIQTDNYQGGGENNVRAEYVTRAGRQAFECFGWMNGHAIEYRFPAGVNVLRLGYRESGYASKPVGTFSCDDAFLNRLREKAARTLYLTMRDTYMDCPDRERAEWWGDVVNELGEVFYSFDRGADRLTRKAILELIGWQKPDGVLFSPVPAGNWEKDLPMQMLASIGRQGFWTYAFYSGDVETLRAVYPGVKRYLQIWNVEENGLVKVRSGGWPWGDWGEGIDMNLLANVWYHLALQGQREMAKALGHTDDLPWIEARLRGIERSFQSVYWTGRDFRSPDHRDAADDRGNALAVVAGLVRRDQYPALIEHFESVHLASPYMEKYVLEALCLMDEPARAQQRMKRRFGRMVDHPRYTTLWEGWGIGAEGYGGGSINHAWSGGPLTIMSQYFAGIAPTGLGFSTYEVRPQLGSLSRVAAGIETKYGRIEVAIKRDAGAFAVDIASPQGTTGVVALPAGSTIGSVEAQGTVVWSDGRPAAAVTGLRPLGLRADGRLCFEVEPGAWSFRAVTR